MATIRRGARKDGFIIPKREDSGALRGRNALLRGRLASIARIVVLLVVALLFVYPMLGFVLATTRSQTNLLKGGLAFGSLSHVGYDWSQVMGFDSGQFGGWLLNTLVMAGGGTVLAIALSIPSGYAMARLRFPGRRLILMTTLMIMVMPNTVLVVPLFLEVARIHLLDSVWPVIIIFSFFPFGIYLAFIHYRTALPSEILEAGRIDGLSEAGLFFRVAVPLAPQAIALVGFFAFVAAWTNFFLPFLLLPETSHSVIAVGLLQLIDTSQYYNPVAAVSLNVQLYLPELVFAAMLSALPVIFVFLVAQRYLRKGALAGAIKG